MISLIHRGQILVSRQDCKLAFFLFFPPLMTLMDG